MTSNQAGDQLRVYTGALPGAATAARRAQRFGWWYFAEHYARQLYRYGATFLISDIGQPLLYFIAMGIGLGSLVDKSAGTVEGVAYLTFIAPALLITVSTQTISNEMTYPVMSGFKWQRFYWGAANTPLAPAQIACGHVLAALARLVFQALAVIALMALFGVPLQPSAALLVVIGPLAALAFGLPLQAYAATLTSEGQEFTFVQRFIIMPMFLFAGTFFPLSVLPTSVQWIGWISPVWHGAELARAVSYGKALSGAEITIHLAYLLTACLIGGALAVRNYARRLRS